MVRFTATIKKFRQQGEKTGWTYIDIPGAVAQQLKPGNKQSFRVKGHLDDLAIERIALIPMGGGDFIMPLNAAIRKAIRKTKGALLEVQMEIDHRPLNPPFELMQCLNDEPTALEQFRKLPKSHQNYFTKWIESAKTEPTKIKRIAHAVSALSAGVDFGSMLRKLQSERRDKLNY